MEDNVTTHTHTKKKRKKKKKVLAGCACLKIWMALTKFFDLMMSGSLGKPDLPPTFDERLDGLKMLRILLSPELPSDVPFISAARASVTYQA